MPPREPAVYGPRQLVDGDILPLNQVFADAFTDRYRRDGLVGVRVPRLNPAVWRYALRDAAEGAMVWTDEDDRIAAFNVAHASGTEGWMGPLAVRRDLQGFGIGRGIVQTAVEWLKGQGAQTIGLETMPRTVDNIGFYAHLGFVPGHLTVTMVGDARRETPGRPALLLSEMREDRRASLIDQCTEALRRSGTPCDYGSEMQLTCEMALGDSVVLEENGEIVGFVLWHAAPLVESRPADELRVLKLFASTVDVFDDLIAHVEARALDQGTRRISVRCQSAFEEAFTRLVDRRYQVRWTDLRMTLEGYGTPNVPNGAILFSNWEI